MEHPNLKDNLKINCLRADPIRPSSFASSPALGSRHPPQWSRRRLSRAATQPPPIAPSRARIGSRPSLAAWCHMAIGAIGLALCELCQPASPPQAQPASPSPTGGACYGSANGVASSYLAALSSSGLSPSSWTFQGCPGGSLKGKIFEAPRPCPCPSVPPCPFFHKNQIYLITHQTRT